MRAFHLLSEKYALQALQNQRLKVATFNDLNDPFELLASDLTDKRVRRGFRLWKDRTSKTIGLLCFSRRWRNPLLWSHYADRHRGIALEVEIDDELVVPVRYSGRRLQLDVRRIMSTGGFTADLAEQVATTKSKHWSYEEEIRVPVNLSECIVEGNLRFEKLAGQLKITGLVPGALSKLTSREVQGALPRGHRVTLRWARLAFSSYDVVRNKAKPVQIIDGAA